MMTSTSHPLVADYLTRLRAAASRLPADEAAGLVADIEEHIAAATATGLASEADIRNLLDRLGRPDDLVAEIAPPPALPLPTPASTRRVEAPAVTLLFVAEVFALTYIGVGVGALAWIAGLILVAMSLRWSGAHKLRAALVLGSGFPVMVLGVLLTSVAVFRSQGGTCSATSAGDQTCTDGGGMPIWPGIVVGLLAITYVTLQIIVARRLLRAAR